MSESILLPEHPNFVRMIMRVACELRFVLTNNGTLRLHITCQFIHTNGSSAFKQSSMQLKDINKPICLRYKFTKSKAFVSSLL